MRDNKYVMYVRRAYVLASSERTNIRFTKIVNTECKDNRPYSYQSLSQQTGGPIAVVQSITE